MCQDFIKVKVHVRGEQRGQIIIIIIPDQLVDVLLVLVDVLEDVEADLRDVDLMVVYGAAEGVFLDRE